MVAAVPAMLLLALHSPVLHLYRSVQHPSCPETTKHVRVTDYCSEMVIEATNGSVKEVRCAHIRTDTHTADVIIPFPFPTLEWVPVRADLPRRPQVHRSLLHRELGHHSRSVPCNAHLATACTSGFTAGRPLCLAMASTYCTPCYSLHKWLRSWSPTLPGHGLHITDTLLQPAQVASQLVTHFAWP